MKVNFQPNTYQNKQNFKGTYIIQIPHKAFSNPENIKGCSRFVADQISDFMHPTGFWQKFNHFLNIFCTNFLCYPEKFSYMFSKSGMETNNLNYSLQWLRTNTELPIEDALEKNYHSFFIYTNKDARNVFKQIKSVCQHTSVSEFCEKYTDLHMISAAVNAKIGVGLDKAMNEQYKNATIYRIEDLSELKEIAQKIN